LKTKIGILIYYNPGLIVVNSEVVGLASEFGI
jgi:hypothetical protein